MHIRSVGVIGAGTMGADIAQSGALGGFEVRLYDSRPGAAEAARGKIAGSLARAVDKGRMGRAEAEAALSRVRPAAELAELGACQLLIEAIVENFEAKAALFESLSEIAGPDALIATNTSSLRVSELARHVERPERFIGLHYFFPAAVNPLLEVIRGDASSEMAIEGALGFAQATGKQPILCRDVSGFAVNRYFVPYLNEAARLAEEGHAPGAIERRAKQLLDAAVGPFRVMDLTKPIIAVHAARTLERLGAFYAPAPLLVRQGESGELWQADETAAATAEAEREIDDRLLGAVFLAALQALDQDVASPADLDLGAKLALQWKRPPCQLMDALGREAVLTLLKPLLARHGGEMPASSGRIGALRTE